MTPFIEKNPGSYRDRRGYIFHQDDAILRTIRTNAKLDYENLRDKKIILKSIEKGFLIETDEIFDSDISETLKDTAYVVRHAKIPFVSYPYEWSFDQLKAAALHHLEFQLFLLDQDVILRDASAYNVQFVGAKPIFIDLLSLAPYRAGEYWTGHRQFCEQFLNPLLLRALKGIPHNSWYRGSLEGIGTAEFAKLLNFTDKFSWNVFTQVILQARLERAAINAQDQAIRKAKAIKPLKQSAYRMMLNQFHSWISKLTPKNKAKTIWGEYAGQNTYLGDNVKAKRNVVLNFVEKYQSKHVIDLGCNTGDYSVAALEGGVEYVTGYDFDINAIEDAFKRSQQHALQFLPLYLDAANPSPNQGWLQVERQGFHERNRVDAVLALAFTHHLAIGRNIPLDQVLRWITDIAPRGLIEFVPKNDETVNKLLALRKDIFSDYTEENFINILSAKAQIVGQTQISASGRKIFEFGETRL